VKLQHFRGFFSQTGFLADFLYVPALLHAMGGGAHSSSLCVSICLKIRVRAARLFFYTFAIQANSYSISCTVFAAPLALNNDL
jgi:hypothetical protein